MAIQNYGECERRVLLSEGGYTNHPRDPGGPTNWGITLAVARLHWKADATADDMRAMPRSVAERIYKEMYWNVLHCDELASGLDYTAFDYGVNSGVGRARRVLNTIQAAHPNAPPSALINLINDERLAFLRRLPTWDAFGAGWERRVNAVKAFSLHLAEPLPVAPPHPESHDVSAKGYEQAQEEDQNESADPQSVPQIRQNETPATTVTPRLDASPRPSKGFGRFGAWGAAALGGTGGLDWLNQMNDYASAVATAKFNVAELNVSGALSWLIHNPAALLAGLIPLVIVALAAWVWDEHGKYKALLAATAK